MIVASPSRIHSRIQPRLLHRRPEARSWCDTRRVEELRWAGARRQADLLQSGAVTGAELVEVVRQATERLDPLLNAVVAPLFDRAVRGVPMLLKDAGQEISGTPHWVGVAALRDIDSRSTDTTALAERFEAAGLSIVGKSACPQLSNGATTEPRGFPPTRNPWDLDRSAGGSSGGSAAAVAAGLVSVAHGSDATGSLRCPAALCGVATFVPSAGVIQGVPPAGQPSNDAWRDFVLARHAEDLTFVFEALTGRRPAARVPRLRVGVLDHDPELGIPLHPACRDAARTAGSLLEQLGHQVDRTWPAALDHLWERAARSFFVVSDAVRPAVLRWVSDRLGRQAQRGDVDGEVFDAAERAASRSDEDVAAAEATIAAAVAEIPGWWDDHDLLVTPTTFQPAWPLGGNPGPRELGTLLAPFSLSGQPALSLPMGMADDALPVGAQIVGRHGSDGVLLRLAEELQAVHDWTARRPAAVEEAERSMSMSLLVD